VHYGNKLMAQLLQSITLSLKIWLINDH